MPYHISDVAFSSSVKKFQENEGSRSNYQHLAESRDWQNSTSGPLRSFIALNKAKVGRQHESTILEASQVVSQSRCANFRPGPLRKLLFVRALHLSSR